MNYPKKIAALLLCINAIASIAQTPPTNKPLAAEPVAAPTARPSADKPVVSSPIEEVVPAGSLDVAIARPVVIPPIAFRSGDRLSVILGQWLKSQSIDLSWEASAATPGRIRDIEFTEEYYAQGGSLKPILIKLLVPFGFDADIVDAGRQRMVIVRNTASRF